ncbi:hypothetical protein PG999_003767 [Apiospora kogelbergensis]|uniref:O-methyltransferase C-terminal domain-containing protein n=1 Tax=Apiospora kogelbergensis TaxID=1337665 RepID=A0AAW0R4Q8_9PEZI
MAAPEDQKVPVHIRDSVLEHATRTKHAVHDASSFMAELQVQQAQYACLHWVVHFEILKQMPQPPASISYENLASKAHVPLVTLRSVLRMLMTKGLLCETTDGRVSHNTISAPFAKNTHFEVWLRHVVNHTVPLFGAMIGATDKYGDSKKINETAFNVVADTELSFFEHLKARPELEHEFDKYMKSQAEINTGIRAEHLLQGFAWSALPAGALVVDVGGGSGATAMVLARAHAGLRLVVQDQAVPIANARAALAAESNADVVARIKLAEHDFFAPQPEPGAAVYLLRTILHDWPDAEALRILTPLARALAPGGRILIMDMVVPAPGTGARTLEAALRQKDLAMMLTFNAKERETDDWYRLVAQVDPPLAIRAIQRPEGCQHSVVEISLASEA